MRLFAQGLDARFWSLIAATFLGFLGIGTVLPGLAPHIRHDLGGSDQSVGFVIGVFSFVALVSRFFSGPLADRKGRKIAFLTGLASCSLAGAAYFMPWGIPGMYVGRTLQGFGEACLYTGAAAWAVELAGISRSAQALGFVSSGIWGGISAGPLVGTWLGTFHRAAAMQVVTALIALAAATLVKEDYEPTPHIKHRRWIPSYLVAPGIAIGFVNVHYPVVAGFLILHLAHHGNSGPAAFSAYAGLMLLSRFFLGGLPDRIAPQITYYFGIAAMASALLILATGPSPLIAVSGTALLGFGFSFPFSSVASTVLRQTPDSLRGSAVGILSAFYDLFVGISSFAAGAVAGRWGYPAAFVMAALALGAAGITGKFIFRPEALPAPETEEVLDLA